MQLLASYTEATASGFVVIAIKDGQTNTQQKLPETRKELTALGRNLCVALEAVKDKLEGRS